jgi:YidC/Oxa1 family membrane protein insertase
VIAAPGDEKRTAIAIILSLLAVISYQHLVLTPRHAAEKQVVANTQGSPTTSSAVQNPGLSSGTTPLPSSIIDTPKSTSLIGHGINIVDRIQAGTLQFTTSLYEGEIALKGGRLISLKLKNFKEAPHDPALLDVVTVSPQGAVPLGVYVGNDSDDAVVYTLSESMGSKVLVPDATGALRIPLVGTFKDGTTLRKTVTFKENSYFFDVSVERSGAPSPLWLEWNHYTPINDPSARLDPLQFTHLTPSSSLKYVLATELVESKGITRNLEKNYWVSLGGKYFMSAFLNQSAELSYFVGNDNNTYFLRSSAGTSSQTFTVYAGPKESDLLAASGTTLWRAVDFGTFAFLARPMLSILHFFYGLFSNYGLAIILLTVFIKLCLYWFSKKSFDSMKKMQDLQPEIKQLREKFKDSTVLNQQMMALYKERGVNPLGGCLPALLQIPVFFALYSALLSSIELRHAPFALWVEDLSSPERLMLFGFPVPLMILLMGGSMFWQQFTQPTPSQDPLQRRMMMFMPVVFTIMMTIFPMPAGLVLYWLVNNVISITQQIYLKKSSGTHPLLATSLAGIGCFIVGYFLVLIS